MMGIPTLKPLWYSVAGKGDKGEMQKEFFKKSVTKCNTPRRRL
jgi:hypothetical protein